MRCHKPEENNCNRIFTEASSSTFRCRGDPRETSTSLYPLLSFPPLSRLLLPFFSPRVTLPSMSSLVVPLAFFLFLANIRQQEIYRTSNMVAMQLCYLLDAWWCNAQWQTLVLSVLGLLVLPRGIMLIKVSGLDRQSGAPLWSTIGTPATGSWGPPVDYQRSYSLISTGIQNIAFWRYKELQSEKNNHIFVFCKLWSSLPYGAPTP